MSQSSHAPCPHASWALLLVSFVGALRILACAPGGGTEETPDGGSEVVTAADASRQDANDAGPDARVDPRDADSIVEPDLTVQCDASPCAVALVGGGDSFCVILMDSTVACWGDNSSGQLGYKTMDSNDGPTPSAVARRVKGVVGATRVGVGPTNGCAVVGGGSVACWGSSGLLSAGADPDARVDPFAGSSLAVEMLPPPAKDVAVGGASACSISLQGVLTCWGANNVGQLGRGTLSAERAYPSEWLAPGETRLQQSGVSSVRMSSPEDLGGALAIRDDQTLFSWGTGSLGRDSSEDPDPVPGPVPLGGPVRSIAVGPDQACALVGSDVMCWGSPRSPRLSTIAATVFSEAVAGDAEGVAGGGLPVRIATGGGGFFTGAAGGHTCAVTLDGRVFCWGLNDMGQLGSTKGIRGSVSVPPQPVSGLPGPAVDVALGASASCVLLRSGAVSCWGDNKLGQQGRSRIDSIAHSDPVDVALPP